MAAITASMVAELRGKTDAPMMECKKALTEADGDMAKAEELLRVKIGTKVRGIRLVDGDHNIDCRIEGFGAMKLKSEFVKKA